MRRFRGQTIQLSGPERLLPTESTGIDLRDARERNRPPREGGYEERPRRFGGEERSFDEAPRRSFRDDGEVPRRTASKRTDEEPSRGDEEECWRSGPARTTSAAPSRFDNETPPERRVSRREEESTPADQEDDWRAGDRRVTIRADDVETRRFGESDIAPRRFGSRQETPIDSRADDNDWRRGSTVETARPAAPLERTRSSRPPTRDEEEGDWRSAKPVSATPWSRKSAEAGKDMMPREAKRAPVAVVAAPVVAPVVASSERWSSSEDEVGPDMEKISKFASRVEKLVIEGGDECVKKIDTLLRKIPVNFGKVELESLEPMKAVISIILRSELLTSEHEVERLSASVAPLLICLETLYGNNNKYQENVIEEIQKLVSSVQLPRLSPETSLVEQLWLSMYENKVIAEGSFKAWLENDTLESPAKATTLFQTEAFRAWLYGKELPGVEATKGKIAPQVEKDEWSDSDDSDIEALVPKRITGINLRPTAVAPLRR